MSEEGKVDIGEEDLTRLPPKMVRRHVEDIERGTLTIEDGRMVASAAVVEALQEYVESERLRGLQLLEHERLRANNRMKGVLSTFVVMLILFCAVAYLFVSMMLGRQQDRIMAAEHSASEAQSAVGQLQDAQEAALAKLAEGGVDAKLIMEMRKQLESFDENNQRQVRALTDALADLEIENASLLQKIKMNGGVVSSDAGVLEAPEARVASIRIPGLDGESVSSEPEGLEPELDLRPRILRDGDDLTPESPVTTEPPASIRVPGLSPE